MALIQNDLSHVRDLGNLPAAIDLNALKEALIAYYDLDIKLHIATRCKESLAAMIQEERR